MLKVQKPKIPIKFSKGNRPFGSKGGPLTNLQLDQAIKDCANNYGIRLKVLQNIFGVRLTSDDIHLLCFSLATATTKLSRDTASSKIRRSGFRWSRCETKAKKTVTSKKKSQVSNYEHPLTQHRENSQRLGLMNSTQKKKTLAKLASKHNVSLRQNYRELFDTRNLSIGELGQMVSRFSAANNPSQRLPHEANLRNNGFDIKQAK